MKLSLRRTAAFGLTAAAVTAASVVGLAGTSGATTPPGPGFLKIVKVVVGTTPTDQIFDIDWSCVAPDGAVSVGDASIPAGEIFQYGTAIAAGSVCTVTEAPTAGFTATISPNPVTIVSGAISLVTVTNTLIPPPPPPPSVAPRTRGYWSNWNTCGTNGNQAANAAATGKVLLDAVLPISLGGYAVDTCLKGVAVFNAGSGRFMENQLAAQLLAAEANVKAGASSCIQPTINAADALLVRIGYAGPPSSKVDSSHPERALATSLKDALDAYNNGLGCA